MFLHGFDNRLITPKKKDGMRILDQTKTGMLVSYRYDMIGFASRILPVCNPARLNRRSDMFRTNNNSSQKFSFQYAPPVTLIILTPE